MCVAKSIHKLYTCFELCSVLLWCVLDDFIYIHQGHGTGTWITKRLSEMQMKQPSMILIVTTLVSTEKTHNKTARVYHTVCYFFTMHRHIAQHYGDVIMSTVASWITSLTIVFSTVYSGADKRKHQSSSSLAFVRWIHRERWIPRTKGQ